GAGGKAGTRVLAVLAVLARLGAAASPPPAPRRTCAPSSRPSASTRSPPGWRACGRWRPGLLFLRVGSGGRVIFWYTLSTESVHQLKW
ncbi:hypothetical protein DFH09DRAFT_1203753, partial [Mycena vulgaris]